MRVCLWLMAVLYFLLAALIAYVLLCGGHPFEGILVDWPSLFFSAASIVGLLTVSCLSFALAQALHVLQRITAQLPRLGSERREEEDREASPGGDEAGTIRDWLWAMGVLCLLPILLFAHYIWSETVLLHLPHRGELYVVGGILFALVTLSCLSFAVAKRLDLQERIAVHLRPLQPPPNPDQPPGSATGEGGNSVALRAEGTPNMGLALQMVGVVCLAPTVPLAYGVLSSSHLYEFFFPRWGWTDLAFLEAFVFILVTLASLSFAVAKNLDLPDRIAAHLPVLQPPSDERTPRGRARERVTHIPVWPHLIGTLCLLLAPLFVYCSFDPFDLDPSNLSLTAALVFALVTLSCLLLGVTRGLRSLARIAAELPRLHPPPSAEQAAVTPLGEDVTAPAPAMQPEEQAPDVPVHEAPVKKGLSSRSRRLLFIGVAILALTAAAFASYHLDPMHAWAHMNRGVTLADLGRHEESLAEFNRAIQLLPEEAKAHVGRGWVLGELGSYEEALAASDRGIQLDPGDAWAHINRGVALGGLGRHEEALAEFNRAVRLLPDEAKAHYDKAWALGNLGRHEEALAAYDRAIQLDPRDAKVHGNRGWVLGELGRYEEAMAAYDRALQLEPRYAKAHGNRGWVLAQLGRHEEALTAYDRALQLDPGESYAHYNRACVYSRLGRMEEALRDLSRAVELDGELREAARRDEQFAGLRSDPEFRELVQMKRK